MFSGEIVIDATTNIQIYRAVCRNIYNEQRSLFLWMSENDKLSVSVDWNESGKY